MTRMFTSKQYGFTAYELLISVLIIGLLIALSYPSWHTSLEKAKHRAAAYQLYQFFQFARSSAVYQRRTLSACASIDKQNCKPSNNWSDSDIILFIDHNRNGSLDSDDEIIRLLTFADKQAHLHWRSFGSKPYLQWQTNGMTYYQNGNFLYCPKDKNAKNAFMLIINAAGRMYFAEDKNKDGIVEGSDGKNIQCL